MKLPKHTCPSIDRIIAQIRYIEEICSDTNYDDVEDLKCSLEAIADTLRYEKIEDQLEDLRKSNSELREAAETYEEKCEELEEERDSLIEEARDLKEELRDLKEELRDAYSENDRYTRI